MDAPWHWVVLAIVVIALFGYKKLPDAARSLGRSLRIFKTEIKGMSEDDKKRAEAREARDARPAARGSRRPHVVPPAHADAAAPAHRESSAAAAGPADAATRTRRHADASPSSRRRAARPGRVGSVEPDQRRPAATVPRAALASVRRQTLRRTAVTRPRTVASSPSIG